MGIPPLLSSYQCDALSVIVELVEFHNSNRKSCDYLLLRFYCHIPWGAQVLQHIRAHLLPLRPRFESCRSFTLCSLVFLLIQKLTLLNSNSTWMWNIGNMSPRLERLGDHSQMFSPLKLTTYLSYLTVNYI